LSLKRKSAPAQRLWRVRKQHVWIDARMCASPRGGVILGFYYDGTLMFERACATADLARADADRRLRDLQRAGWNTHW
jgi:hypothetical protein